MAAWGFGIQGNIGFGTEGSIDFGSQEVEFRRIHCNVSKFFRFV